MVPRAGVINTAASTDPELGNAGGSGGNGILWGVVGSVVGAVTVILVLVVAICVVIVVLKRRKLKTATLLNEVVTNQVYANTNVGLTHLNKVATSETKFDDSILKANPAYGVTEQVTVSTNPAYIVTEQVAVSTNPAYGVTEQVAVSTNPAYGANNADPSSMGSTLVMQQSRQVTETTVDDEYDYVQR